MTKTDPTPNPQVQAYLDELPVRPPPWEPPLSERRREAQEETLGESGAPEPVASVEDVRVADVTARLYQPVGGETEVLIWIHGGGWMFHDVDSFDPLARALANAGACAVLSVDYRLAPEHPFPAGLEDCWRVTQWAAGQFNAVAVGGDSSGGNLAAVVALKARESNLRLALQLLVYPVTDYAVDGPYYHEFRSRYQQFAGKTGYGAASQDGIRWLWENYIPDPTLRTQPDASPLRAPTLAGVAPVFMIAAEHDVLLHENEAYADRLEREGVQVDLAVYQGQTHGFFHRLGVMEDARDAVRQSGAALRKAFAPQAHHAAQ